MSREEYDYIVVGGGSAGCVTAYRLVQDFGARVLVLEAGGPDDHHLIPMPAGFVKMIFEPGRLTVEHLSEPQAALGGRRVPIIQANVLGGGSSVNAMTYTRGTRADYEHWQALNLGEGPAWGWDDLLPHFKSQESNQRLGAPFHGVAGPLKVSDSHHPSTDLSRAFLLALQELGLPYNGDVNSGDERGATLIQSTTYRGRRWSAARAFIRPIITDPRLTIRYRSPATRIIFAGDRACGVEYLSSGGSTRQVAHARNEIILSAGSFISPKLLMLSGIGPAAHLQEHQIEVRVDLPGVGQNMQDHNDASIAVLTDANYGYSGEDRGWRMLANGLQYLMFGSGPVASSGSEVTAFLDPTDLTRAPTMQFYCMGVIYPDRGHAKPPVGATLIANLVAPLSRGSMRLRSSNPLDKPIVNPGWLSNPADIAALAAGLRFLLTVTRTPPMARMVTKVAAPGENSWSDDAALATYIRSVTGTNWHPVGSCRMGPQSDPLAVVDPSLRVRGIRGIRVFDGSMMPKIISANTNGPIMAIADRGVDIMMKRVSLAGKAASCRQSAQSV